MRPPSPESNTRIVGAIATAATWYEKNDRRATLEHRPADVPGSLARSPVAGRRSNALVQSCVGGLPQSASAAGCVAPLTAQKVLTRLAGRYIEEDGGRRGCLSTHRVLVVGLARRSRVSAGSDCAGENPARPAAVLGVARRGHRRAAGVLQGRGARRRGHEVRERRPCGAGAAVGPHRHRIQQHGFDVAGDRARTRCDPARPRRGGARFASRHDDGPHRAQRRGEHAEGPRGQARGG